MMTNNHFIYAAGKASKAIHDLEELRNIIVLGLSVHLWTVDDGAIREKTPLRIVQRPAGQSIHFDVSSRYLMDVNIPDPSHDPSKRNPWRFMEFLFNTREDAEQAMEHYNYNIKQSLFT